MPKAVKQSRKKMAIEIVQKASDCQQEKWGQIPIIKKPIKVRSLECRRQIALECLNGTYVPKKFLFRQKQIAQITDFIEKSLYGQKLTRILLVTGSPGSGKTLSINTILKTRKEKIVKFNANTAKTMKQVCSILSKIILSKKEQLTILQIIKQLEEINQSYIIHIQEIELLFKHIEDFSDFLQLFSPHKKIKILLIGTSNTIDTLEKYEQSKKVILPDIKNIVFSPYSAQMLKDIIKDKLVMIEQQTDFKINYPDKLLSFSAKKLQTIKKGDLRFALQFIKSVIYQLLYDSAIQLEEKIVTIEQINKSLQKMDQTKGKIIQSLPLNQQILLVALYSNIKRSDSLEITIKELTDDVKWVCQSIVIKYNKDYLQGLVQLQQYGFISRRVRNGIQKIMLKLSRSQIDVTFSEHAIFKKMFQSD